MFLRLPDPCVPAHRGFSETGLAARNGFSLTRNGSPFRGFHSGVIAPSLLLRPPCSVANRPVRSSAPRPVRFAPEPAVSRPNSRCLFASSLTGSARRFHSPSGLYPSRSKRSAAFGPVSPPSGSPDFQSLPVPTLSLGGRSGSSFLVRYVPGGLLFLKPLGTFPTMRRKRLEVNRFL